MSLSTCQAASTRLLLHRVGGLWRVSLLAAALLAQGCGPAEVDSVYGKRRGAVGGSSVNGTAVLAGMFQAAGHRVMTWRRLSPKLEEATAIVWAPDDFQPPSPDQRRFLERWLWNQPGRTLVYIGRDYNASVTYWHAVLPQAPPEQMVQVYRRLATAQAEHDAQRTRMPKEMACDWFVLRRDGVRRQVNHLEGPWSKNVAAAKTEIPLAARLDMPTARELRAWTERESFVGSGQVRVEPLLRCGEDTLVSRITTSEGNDGQMLVVVNGSFALNVPLVNREHRKLAFQLVSACGPPGKVVFLESGPGGPPIYDQEPDAHAPTGFEVLTVWPIGVVTAHGILLGITVCFALFPVFGRARQLDQPPLSDFGKHVEAFGELLESTRDEPYAVARLRHYQEHVRRDANASRRQGT